ncbi:MAG TPA: 3'-5' exonuclease [Acholeplasmataceae bacterium]|nr:3'-5' exonuclease [Acholeplasmataceae bacterium]
MKKYKNILIFDFETTGLDPINDEIIEIGAIKLKLEENNYELTDDLSLLLVPSAPITSKITEITGITNEMLLREGVSQEEGFNKLSMLIEEDTLLIAYNIAFDLGFLETFYKRHWDRNYEVNNDLLDVMAVYKDRHQFPHRLESAIAKYSVTIPNSHRASDDAKATFEVLKALKNERDVIDKFINVIGYNPNYPYRGPRPSGVRVVPHKGGRLEIEKGL